MRKKIYKHKEKYTLDFTNVKNYYEIHQVIEKELDFPDYYGANWDAFWDCATDMVSDKGLNIEIIGLDKIYAKYQEDIDIFLKMLKMLKHSYNNKYSDIITITVHHGQSKVEIA